MKARKRLASQSELTYLKVARRMRIAVQIAEAMEEQHISKKELAQKMGRQPSEITKWLSGDQNFTSDTLTELSYYLHREITGVKDTATYLNVNYDDTLVIYFPGVGTSEKVSRNRRWSQLPNMATLFLNR